MVKVSDKHRVDSDRYKIYFTKSDWELVTPESTNRTVANLVVDFYSTTAFENHPHSISLFEVPDYGNPDEVILRQQFPVYINQVKETLELKLIKEAFNGFVIVSF